MFKVGDRVFNYQYGWGTINEELTKFILVLFDSCKSVSIPFYKDGKETSRSERPTLSFTEYTLEGFSQERPPVELPEVGDWCLVRDNKQTVWQAGFFKEYRPDNEFPFVTDIGNWKQIKRIKIID